MDRNQTSAINRFISELPGSASRIAPDEIEWVISQLRDPELLRALSTKICTEAARRIGSAEIVPPALFVQRLAAALAVHFERDDLLYDEDPLDREQSIWVDALQKESWADPEEHKPDEEHFRCLPLCGLFSDFHCFTQLGSSKNHFASWPVTDSGSRQRT